MQPQVIILTHCVRADCPPEDQLKRSWCWDARKTVAGNKLNEDPEYVKRLGEWMHALEIWKLASGQCGQSNEHVTSTTHREVGACWADLAVTGPTNKLDNEDPRYLPHHKHLANDKVWSDESSKVEGPLEVDIWPKPPDHKALERTEHTAPEDAPRMSG